MIVGKGVVRNLSTQNATLIGPAVRLLLHDYNINLDSVKGSGPKGNVLKSDVWSHIKGSNLQPQKQKVPLPLLNPDPLLDQTTKLKHSSPFGDVVSKRRHRRTSAFQDIPLSGMRATIARRLTQAKCTVPHNYTSVQVRAENLTAFRKTLSKQGIKVSVNDFIVKAAALSLRAVPEVNVQWVEHDVRRVPEVDVSIAVATPSGLITPIVFRADQLPVDKISHVIRELAIRAKDNKLKPQEFQGGSFTVSNLGMFGIHTFTAIINPPQTAVLAVGGTHTQLDSEFNAKHQFSLTLCYDNRAVTEVDAHRFLQNMQQLLGHPDVSLSGGLDLTGEHHDLFYTV
ncbi:unnamed protein product [Bursaphelenchus okinawaensis]|uniref:Peripheral subunit-binding (PSBD) domain-containing protein n=1 Tax=Bursaphelenchus okinawaensis TaxID=465554 RepID=A0A811KVU8_9BILA|nr:unnamed protein product [Bursaphelenchus okinawaensis]CAG9112538.1 unnamed protein product [Bursaphelenchus okinawaensis]